MFGIPRKSLFLVEFDQKQKIQIGYQTFLNFSWPASSEILFPEFIISQGHIRTSRKTQAQKKRTVHNFDFLKIVFHSFEWRKIKMAEIKIFLSR